MARDPLARAPRSCCALARRSYALLPVAAIIVVLYLPWFATSRTSFLYYMTPVAPFLAILVAGRPSACSPAASCRDGAGMPSPESALATAVLWQPLGLGAGWLFWTLPRRVGDSLGWVGVAVGVLLALAGRDRPALAAAQAVQRPWIAMVVAGLVIGIVVGFIPIVLASADLARVLLAHHLVPELDLRRAAHHPAPLRR